MGKNYISSELINSGNQLIKEMKERGIVPGSLDDIKDLGEEDKIEPGEN